MQMRLFVGLFVAVVFAAALLLDTQAVLQLAWLAAAGRLGTWPRLIGAAVAVLALGVVATQAAMSLRRSRSRSASRQPGVGRRNLMPAVKRMHPTKSRIMLRKGNVQSEVLNKEFGKRKPSRPRKK